MKKRFTLLFAALLAFVGVAKADFTQQWTSAPSPWTDEVVTDYPTELDWSTGTDAGGNTVTNHGTDGHSVRKAETSVLVSEETDVKVSFKWSSGSHSLWVLGVDLIDAEGQVVKSEYALKQTGGAGNVITYTLASVPAGDYTLRYFICDKGSDHEVTLSNGTITVTGASLPGMENVVTSADDLSNDKVYTVSTNDRGSWVYSVEKNALTSTNKAGVAVNAEDPNQQFAFVTEKGQVYLYSVGANKFVAKKGNATTVVDNLEAFVTLEASGNTYFPVVVALNGENHMGVSNGYDPAVITFHNSLTDGGNQSKIVAVADMSEATRGNLTAAFAAAEAALLPQVSTAEAPRYYTIGSYDRGGYLTNMGPNKFVEHVDATTNSLWYFTKADDNGGVYVCNKNGGYLDKDRKVSEAKAVWYVLSNGVNFKGASISSTKPISGESCIDANNHNTGVGAWNPSAKDWQGTTWVFVESNVVTYEYTYGDKVYTQEIIAAKGGAYPDYRLPHGVVATEAKPEGVVDGDTKVTRELAFSFPVSDENSTKAVMIGAHNSEALLWRAVEDGVTVQKNATAVSENYYWAIYPTFAENSLAYTVTIKNLGTGKYIYSTSGEDKHEAGVVTLADEGSVFTLESGNQFKLATGKYLSINSANVDAEQILGTNSSHGGTKNQFVAYPGLDAEVKDAFMEKLGACGSLYDNYEGAFEALSALEAKMDELSEVVEPIFDNIQDGNFVSKASVVAATEAMATTKAAIEPVLAYYCGDYKAAADKAKAFFGKLEEGSAAHTALAAAITTFEEVAAVTTVTELEAKVTALNTVYDSQYAAYDLSEVKETFATQVEAFAALGEDEAFTVLLAIKEQYTTTKASVDALAEKIAADALVLKSEVQEAMGIMESFGSLIMEYTYSYAPAVKEAQGLLAQLEEDSEDYEYLAGAIAEFGNVTPESWFDMASYMLNQAVKNLCDIDEAYSIGEADWVEATTTNFSGQVFPLLANADLTESSWDGESLEEWNVYSAKAFDFDNGIVTFRADAFEVEKQKEEYKKDENNQWIKETITVIEKQDTAAYLKQTIYGMPAGQYRLTGKGYHQGAKNAKMFVGKMDYSEGWDKAKFVVVCEKALPEATAFGEDLVIEFTLDEDAEDEYVIGYSCDFDALGASMVVGGFKFEMYGAVTSTLRKDFQKIYNGGDKYMGVVDFSNLKEMTPYSYFEAMHPAYDALFEEVAPLYYAMFEGNVLKTKVEKAIEAMEAMIAKFKAVADYLQSDTYNNATIEAETAIAGYMEESSVYADLMKAYNAAMGVVYYEEEVEDEIEVMAKYYATFTSVADIEKALEALANALEAAKAKIPTKITLDEDEVVLEGEPSVQLTATVEGSETADKSVFWESDNEDVVTVENGLVTVVGKIGDAYITAYSIHKNVYAECYVNVTALPTGIDGFEVKVETVIYDIHGRQVEKMEKGFYIVNGKKVLVK